MENGQRNGNISFSQRLKDFPDYGAYFLAFTWLIFRVISIFAMLTIIGALGYTIGAFDHAALEPPSLLIKGMIMSSVAVIFSIMATFFWYHKADRGLWVTMCFDMAFFGIFCYLSTALSEPAVYPQCFTSNVAHPYTAASTTSANVFAGDMSSRIARRDEMSTLATFVEANHVPCAAIIVFWAPCVALSAAFFCTGILEPMLWYKCHKEYPPNGYGSLKKKQQMKAEMA